MNKQEQFRVLVHSLKNLNLLAEIKIFSLIFLTYILNIKKIVSGDYQDAHGEGRAWQTVFQVHRRQEPLRQAKYNIMHTFNLKNVFPYYYFYFFVPLVS